MAREDGLGPTSMRLGAGEMLGLQLEERLAGNIVELLRPEKR